MSGCMTRKGSHRECPKSRASTPSRDEAPALLGLARLIARQAAREAIACRFESSPKSAGSAGIRQKPNRPSEADG